MRRISHDTYASVFATVYLGLIVNVMLAVACAPFLIVAMTTDPAASWPLLLLTAPLCAPALAGALTAFRAHGMGEGRVVRVFWAGWRRTAGKSLAIGALAAIVVTLALIDVRAVATASWGVLVVPLCLSVVLLALAVAPVALTALVEAPGTPLRVLLSTAAVFAVRRWYLSAVSLLVLAGQAVLFTTSPALALGLTAAPALYLVWANARFSLRPVLPADAAVAV
ncbi:ferredoxin-NADPH reductase [Microbacterium sp. BH-3-3-3]|uniref:ferredoxin-NADPH reductase n=1 Tax=Microbacterium sp. BH-3-3-3 TaxID=1906742 RepID=UPI00119F67E2|nr:ferredoxin-NADPH reductase [Microbacterium sp. BH-3-3-3]